MNEEIRAGCISNCRRLVGHQPGLDAVGGVPTAHKKHGQGGICNAPNEDLRAGPRLFILIHEYPS